MAVIALVAANCAALRACFSSTVNQDIPLIMLGGLLPLANAQIISLYLIARRYRISLRRRPAEERRGRFATIFGAFNGLLLAILIATCVMVPDYVLAYLEIALAPFESWFHALRFERHDLETLFFVYVVLPVLWGTALSGPPLLLASLLGWVSSRIELVVVTRRAPAPPSDADSPAVQSEFGAAS